MRRFQAGWKMAIAVSLLVGAAYVVKGHHVTAAEMPAGSVDPSQGLVVTYGTGGLERLSWKGQTLTDVRQTPGAGFHIWHMAATDLNGRSLTEAEYGWGENNHGRSWDSVTKTWLYQFSWGTIRAQYKQDGNQLDIRITEENRAGSGIKFQGASIYPLLLALPVPEHNSTHWQSSDPKAAGPGEAEQTVAEPGSTISDNTTKPGVTIRHFDQGSVTVVTPEVEKPLYSGCEPRPAPEKGRKTLCAVIVSSTRPDALKDGASIRPAVMPGQSDSFTLSLRFLPPGTQATSAMAKVYGAWASHWPRTLAWKDRRVIGTVYLASSPQAGASPSTANPRRYFSAGETSFNVNSPDGLEKFQAKVLETAEQAVTNLRKLDAQGVITWDIEGEQYPQNTSYICSPDQVAAVAPEMESRISVRGSRLFGMKLDDAYFKILRDAGYKIGVCVRPQHFVVDADGSAHQHDLPSGEVAAELIRKMRFAHDRWGATIFYLDSTVDASGNVLDPGILDQAAKALPDSLLVPEESDVRMYRAAAPFRTFLFHGDLGTPSWLHELYPEAFSLNLVNDVDPARLAASEPALVQAVQRGDVLMVHADYWHPNNDVVNSIYRKAGRR